MKRNVGLLGALLCLLCVVGWSAGAQRPARPMWEYKVISYACPDEKALNELGSQGWELVSAEAHTSADNRGSDCPNLYFKRAR